jgi:hypothetical protein
MLNSPLTRLRKESPGSITLHKLERFFTKKGFPRGNKAINAFELGRVKEPDDRFFRVYAECLGIGEEIVRDAHRRTVAWKQRRDLPSAKVA